MRSCTQVSVLDIIVFKVKSRIVCVVFQGLITCPCKVPVRAPTSPQTCPVAL